MSESPLGLYIAGGTQRVYLCPSMANRHGLIAGATGTGKTVTLQVIAEQFSAIGVPIFMADVKGDLSGMSQPGTQKPAGHENAHEPENDMQGPEKQPSEKRKAGRRLGLHEDEQ